MAINLDLIKKKLQDIESSSKKSAFLWKPKAGEAVIRLVPYQYKPDFPFLDMYFHYKIGKKTYVSLKTYGEPDPIEEFSTKLQQTGDTDDFKLGKKIEPSSRTYVPIIVRGEEDKGVKFWGFGKEIYSELLKTMNDPDYGDISDYKTGRDIVVEYKTPAEANNTYGKISIRVKPNVSPVTTDKTIFTKIKDQQPKIEEVYPKPTYEELEAALKKWLEPAEETAADDVMGNIGSAPAKEKPGIQTPKTESKVAAPKSTAKDAVLNQFDTMLEDDDLPF